MTPLPDALASRLPAIVRRSAVRVEVCPPDPRLSAGYQWPAAERPHTIALAYDRAPTHALRIGGHRLSPATGAHNNPSRTTKGKP